MDELDAAGSPERRRRIVDQAVRNKRLSPAIGKRLNESGPPARAGETERERDFNWGACGFCAAAAFGGGFTAVASGIACAVCGSFA